MQRNSKRSRRNQQEREKFEASLHSVPDHHSGSSSVSTRQPDHDGVARSKANHPVARAHQGPPQRTADGLWLRTERDGTPMINVGLTEAQITEMILLIDDDPDSAEPNEDVLEACRRKFINRLNRMKQILAEQEAAQAQHQ